MSLEPQTPLSDTIELLADLVSRASVTPQDEGCQDLIAARLAKLGFNIETMQYGEVKNLWARHGTKAPLLVFAGHTDVVPTGDLDKWTTPPFDPTIRDGHLYGRGAADMKGGVAAMVTALERHLSENAINGSVALLLTSDEEGPAIDGIAKVVDALDARDEKMDFCVLGEPTSQSTLGDTIKNGRRGSLSAKLTVKGIQGHVAYPHLADNPVHKAFALLQELVNVEWDSGDDNFPATTLQISNAHAGTGASNVIPGEFIVDFNLRYSPATTVEHVKRTVAELISKHALSADISWHESAAPFITQPGSLTSAMRSAVKMVTSMDAQLDTGGGTSDGRFIAKTCDQVIEFGPLNATIHQINECINISDIDALSKIYERLLIELLGKQEN